MPPSRIAGWLAGTVLAGWLVVYNVLRIGGDNPAAAALPALVVGGAAGLVLFAAGFLLVRRLHAAGRVVRGAPERRVVSRATAVRLLGPIALALSAAAVVAIAVAAGMTADYLGIEGDRPRSTLLLIAWNAVFGVWLLDEARRVVVARRAAAAPVPVAPSTSGGSAAAAPRVPVDDREDSVWFACLLTAVLAAVAMSRDILPSAQVVLIVIAGLTAAVVHGAGWRLRGGGGVPLGIPVAVVVAAACLVLPTL